MARTQQFAGGAAGLGGTISARQFLDEAGQNRLTQPSVLYGVGTGALASLLWFVDVDTPVLADEFWAGHAITALPTGLFYAVFPKRAGQTTTEQFREAISGTLGNGGNAGNRRQQQNQNGNGNRSQVEVQSGRNR